MPYTAFSTALGPSMPYVYMNPNMKSLGAKTLQEVNSCIGKKVTHMQGMVEARRCRLGCGIRCLAWRVDLGGHAADEHDLARFS